MMIRIVLITLLALQGITCQDQCQCDANVLNPGGRLEWFYTFDQLFYDTCQDVHTCQDTCYVYLKNITDGFRLEAIIYGVPLGEFACQKLVHDVPRNSSILFQSESCATGWIDVETVPGFCCINGHFSAADC